MMIGLVFVVFFACLVGVILLVVGLALRAAVRSAKAAERPGPGQPYGRPGNLDWLPEQDDPQRWSRYDAWPDPGATGGNHGHGHDHHSGHHDGHHAPGPGPSFDSSPSPSHHDSGGGHHH
ncbi:hypothetical protein GCM10009760_27370 [Kitasatospora kazusensis]|uniref:Secreted protein n=1 Tax=Kitasatospora kazusensis TaxID=407974 RepID=A0ABP5L608_9ACTN